MVTPSTISLSDNHHAHAPSCFVKAVLAAVIAQSHSQIVEQAVLCAHHAVIDL